MAIQFYVELVTVYISTRKDTEDVRPRHPTAERGIRWLPGRSKDTVQVQAGPWVAASPLPRPQEWPDEPSSADPWPDPDCSTNTKLTDVM